MDVTKHLSASKRTAALVFQPRLASPAPVPQTIRYLQGSSGQFADQPVSMTGVLVSQMTDSAFSSVVLQTDGHLVTGYISQPSQIAEYPVGSQVRVRGICRIVVGGGSPQPHLFYLEMQNPADFELLAQPSWFTVWHMVSVLLAVLILVLFLTIRAVFRRWRTVNQAAWKDRSMTVARERSRILEMISANRPLQESIQEICRSAEILLPGVECRHLPHSEEEPVPHGASSGSRAKPVFEIALQDEEDHRHGSIAITTDNPRKLAADRQDIFKLLSELATMALRQSLLYRGLVYHSTHDPLTELPNRRLFENRLDEAIAEAAAKAGQLAVIYIDINRFKYVNDKFGHKIGDLYLQQISSRLRAQLRSVDTLARIGGDEFVVIAPFPEAFDRAYALTVRLQKCFCNPFELEGTMIEGSASFGFARFPEHGTTAEELTRHADHAMYLAKHESRISEEAHALAIITPNELELALLKGRFRLAYQPQFSAAGELTGLEALLRLEDPVLGIITPDAFISVAEKHPVIIDIGEWTLRTAIQDAIRWDLAHGPMISIAVNVSVRQLEEPGYAHSVMNLLSELNFPPERLELELIERSLMHGGDKVTQQLVLLRDAGVRISLDDFGTEQSCLSVLHRLPIDTIKLDSSFIRAMDGEPGVLPIIQAIVSMAHSLGKRVVAEAIEHIGPVAALVRMGEMDFQGFLLSRPVPAEEIPSQLEKWQAGIAMPEAFASARHRGSRRRG